MELNNNISSSNDDHGSNQFPETSKRTKIAIYIPARNAARTIVNVLERIPTEIKERAEEIFVVDNNSKDETSLLVLQYKKEKEISNLKIIHNKQDVGYGGSQKIAYQYAIDRGFDVIVMIHGDAQYAPEFLPKLLEPLEEGADLVFGSRMTGDPKKGGMPSWKISGNKILTKIENYVLETNLSEFHSGYRVYNVNALKKVPFNKCSNNYQFDTEILVLFAIAKLNIQERTIPTHYGSDSESPSPTDLLVYSSNILLTMAKYFLHKKGLKSNELFLHTEEQNKSSFL